MNDEDLRPALYLLGLAFLGLTVSLVIAWYETELLTMGLGALASLAAVGFFAWLGSRIA